MLRKQSKIIKCPIFFDFLGTINVYGAGSSVAGPMYQDASVPYASYRLANSNRRVEIDFTISSSGAGKIQLETQKVGDGNPMISFAGSESLLTANESKANPDLVTFPIFAG